MTFIQYNHSAYSLVSGLDRDRVVSNVDIVA